LNVVRVPSDQTVTISATGTSNGTQAKYSAELLVRGSPEGKIRFLKSQIDELNLPIGWVSDPPTDVETASGQFNPRRFPGWLPHDAQHWESFRKSWWNLIQHQFLGWLITAIAVSLGAPFWFDVVNKFVRLRTGGNMGTTKPEKDNA
jgi:hypothetical protein